MRGLGTFSGLRTPFEVDDVKVPLALTPAKP